MKSVAEKLYVAESRHRQYCIFDIYSAGERVRFDAAVYVVNFQSDFGLYDKCGYSLLGLINNRIFAGSSLQT